MTGEDAAKAYRMQWALIRAPEVAVRLLGERIKISDWVFDRPSFEKRVTELDSPRFAVREAAEKVLANGRYPNIWVEKALSTTKSEEVRVRLESVVAERTKQPDAVARHVSRAVQVLELTDTVEAKALLKKWTAATTGSYLEQEATAALDRLGR